MRRLAVVAIACFIARIAAADPETDFRAAQAHAVAGNPAAITELETLGAARPISRWSDDAWSEAARLAEKAGDFERARRDLEQVVAINADEQLVRRARASLVRIAAFAGAAGEWSSVAAKHERLAAQIAGPGDPKPAIGELDALVRANPAYPRATSARLVIAQGFERDGDNDAAATALHEALAAATKPDDVARIDLALARLAIRRGELDDAATEIDAVAAALPAERLLVDDLRDDLGVARRRAWIRLALWLALAGVVVVAAIVARHDAGSWRGAARAIAKPPIEVLYLAPVSLVIAVVASTGNPMVGRAVRTIAVAGIAIAWLSGAMLELARKNLRRRRVVVHAAIAIAVVAAAVYLVVDHDRMIDLVVETWRSGPASR